MPKFWERSLSVERDNNDDRATGCKAYFYDAGTTTPQTVYEDSAETTPHASPVVADAYGRWPAVFIPYSSTGYRVRIITSGGVQLSDTDDITNPDPVDATAALTASQKIATGQVLWEPVDTTRDGYVRLNGRTIGNAASGGTERANADTSDLFTYLYNNNANGQAAVSGGRGASAAADFAANKTIALLDLRGALIGGLDTMGNSAASLLGSAPVVNGSATLAGSILGANTHVLLAAELAAHAHDSSVITVSTGGAHVHTVNETTAGAHNHTGATAVSVLNYADTAVNINVTSDGAVLVPQVTGQAPYSHSHNISTDGAHTHSVSINSGGSHNHTLSGNTGSTGSDTAHNNLPRMALGTFFQKL